LFFHILGVFGIAGAATAFLVVISAMRRAKTVQEVRLLATFGAIIDKLFPVAAIILLVSGAYEVNAANFDFGDGWVNFSATALIVGSIVGYLVNGRRSEALRKAANAAPEGPVPQALSARIHDPWVFGTTHALTLMVLAIIWNMTTKPGDAEAAIVIILAVVIGAGSAMPMVSRRQAILEGAQPQPVRSE
jgi:uncharacterized membrane protein